MLVFLFVFFESKEIHSFQIQLLLDQLWYNSYFEKNDGLDINDSEFLLSEWNGEYSYWDKFLEMDKRIKSSKEYPNKKNIWERN